MSKGDYNWVIATLIMDILAIGYMANLSLGGNMAAYIIACIGHAMMVLQLFLARKET